MKNKIDLLKLTNNLTPKEKAKMVISAVEEEMKTNRCTLTQEEIDSLRTFGNARELAEYHFYTHLRGFGLDFINLTIEICLLKNLIAYQMSWHNYDKELLSVTQNNYNFAHTLKKMAEELTEKFDYPVLDKIVEEKINQNLEFLETTKKVINQRLNLDFLSKNDPKKNIQKPNYITEAKIDNKIVEQGIELFTNRFNDIYEK